MRRQARSGAVCRKSAAITRRGAPNKPLTAPPDAAASEGTKAMSADHNTTEVLVGGAVLAVAIGFLVYAGQVTGVSRGQDAYPLAASFRSADGVSVGTDVRMAG